jgi:hypothetical protein
MFRLTYLMPDCWLEVSLHTERPATGQLDQNFPRFSFVPEQMLIGIQIPFCTACFTCSPPNGNIEKFRPTLT